MKQEVQVSAILNVFPKLYYFIPPIEPFKVKVSPRKERIIGSSTVEINEFLAATLWLLETLEKEQTAKNNRHPSQGELYHLMARLASWDRSRFSKELQKLYAAGLISIRINSNDRRQRELALTTKGKSVLKKVKNQRAGLISYLIQGRTAEDLEAILLAINYIANAAWEKMNLASKR